MLLELHRTPLALGTVETPHHQCHVFWRTSESLNVNSALADVLLYLLTPFHKYRVLIDQVKREQELEDEGRVIDSFPLVAINSGREVVKVRKQE